MKKVRLLEHLNAALISKDPFLLGPFHLNEESCTMGKIISFDRFKDALKEIGTDMTELENQGLNSNPFHSDEGWIYFGIETETEILISYWDEDYFATLPLERLDSFCEGDHVGMIDLCGASRGIDRWLVHAESTAEVVKKITEFEESYY